MGLSRQTPAQTEGEDLHRRAGKQWLKAQQHVRERLGQDITEQMIELNAALVALRD